MKVKLPVCYYQILFLVGLNWVFPKYHYENRNDNNK